MTGITAIDWKVARSAEIDAWKKELEARHGLVGADEIGHRSAAHDYANNTRVLIESDDVTIEEALDYFDHNVGPNNRHRDDYRRDLVSEVNWRTSPHKKHGKQDYHALAYSLGESETWTDSDGNVRLKAIDQQVVSGATDLEALANMVGCTEWEMGRASTETVCYSRVRDHHVSHLAAARTSNGRVTYVTDTGPDHQMLTGVVRAEHEDCSALWPVLQHIVCVLTGTKLQHRETSI